MSSYEIKYDTSNVSEAQAKAIKDCKDWLGTKQFNKVVKILQGDNGQSSKKMVLFGLSFQGIQGYPAEVMVELYHSK
jgi:hypothetical protein